MKKYVAPAMTIEKLAFNNIVTTSDLKVYDKEATGPIQSEERKGNPIWD